MRILQPWSVQQRGAWSVVSDSGDCMPLACSVPKPCRSMWQQQSAAKKSSALRAAVDRSRKVVVHR